MHGETIKTFLGILCLYRIVLEFTLGLWWTEYLTGGNKWKEIDAAIATRVFW